MGQALSLVGDIKRPYPPDALRFAQTEFGLFYPAPEVREWSDKAFLDERSLLFNEDHVHLAAANIGFLWTNAVNVTKGIEVIGMAELPKPHPALGKWAKARWNFLLLNLFGAEYRQLDFLITLSAPWVFDAKDVDWCALVDHEMYHCAQAMDAYGNPKFHSKTFRPIFALKGHDVEEHVGVVRRYGPVGRNVKEMVDAARRRPTIAPAAIRQMCGTCLARAA